MVGKKFGRLTVLSMEKGYKCKCLCECGAEKLTSKYNLTGGSVRSCGCLQQESRITHGLHSNPIYTVWASMLKRCSEQGEWKNRYFDKGICVCEDWRNSPTKFITWSEENGYEHGLQIDRIDNSKGYSPDNCRFISALENCHNRRTLWATNTSGYAGVSLNKVLGKFRACIQSINVNTGKPKHLGYFDTAWEACQARNNFITANDLPHRIQEKNA